jgi:hypothetical protein
MPKINSCRPSLISNINRFKRSLIVGATSFFICAGTAQAADVYYVTENGGGFGFAGKYSDISKLYPLAAKSVALPEFRSDLLKHVQQTNPSGYDLKINTLSNNADSYTKSIVLDMVLDGETVSIEQYDVDGTPVYKLDILLHAEAIFFDYAKKTILTTVPISEEYIGTVDQYPSISDEQEAVNQALFENPGNNLVERFAASISTAELPKGIIKFAQVTKVTIAPRAQASITNHPEMGWSNRQMTKNAVANEFSSAVDSIAGIPLEPYAIDSATGQMAVVFSNTSAYNFTLPTPSYHIHITLDGFKNVPYQSSVAGYSQIYGAFVHVKVVDPLLNDVYMDAAFKNGVVKIIPKTQVTVATGPAYQAALRGLFFKLAKALNGANGKWVASASSTPGIKRMLSNTNNALESCKQ